MCLPEFCSPVRLLWLQLLLLLRNHPGQLSTLRDRAACCSSGLQTREDEHAKFRR